MEENQGSLLDESDARTSANEGQGEAGSDESAVEIPGIDPGPALAAFQLGNSLLGQARYDDAAAAFASALQAVPGHGPTAKLLARAVLLSGHPDWALLVLQRWTEPKEDIDRLTACCEVAQGRFGRALEILEAESRECGDLRPIYAYALWHSGRCEESLAVVKSLDAHLRGRWIAIVESMGPPDFVRAVLGDPAAAAQIASLPVSGQGG